MDYLAIRAENKFGINLLWDEKILSTLAKGYDCRYGVRSIKHEVERQIVTPLALAHQSGELPLGTIHILRHHSKERGPLPGGGSSNLTFSLCSFLVYSWRPGEGVF